MSRKRPFLITLLALAGVAGIAAWAADPPPATSEDGPPEAHPLEAAVGQPVVVELRSGRTWDEATLQRVDRHPRTNEIVRLRLQIGRRTRSVGMNTIARVTQDGRAVFESSDEDADRSDHSSNRRAQTPEERRQWLARLKSRNIEPWPEATDADHDRALARYRKIIEEVQQLLPGAELYETERFLFVSNIPANQVAPYVKYLDQMYEWMCRVYGIPPEEHVWLGRKAPVFAFLHEREFAAFEVKYFQHRPQNVYGVCHQGSQGDVIIACYRGDDPNDFGQMLVHETSHGFIHRYRTKARLPNWVNEGMAEFIGAEMVPASKSVPRKELAAVARLKQAPALGGNFFNTESIDTWQYGVASSLNRFMIQSNQKAYVRFIEGMKEGLRWHEALQAAYGSTPQEMLTAYGQWLGVPDISP